MLAIATTWPGASLHVEVLVGGVGRGDQRVARDDLELLVGVRPADQVGDPAGVAVGLLQADDVGTGRP